MLSQDHAGCHSRIQSQINDLDIKSLNRRSSAVHLACPVVHSQSIEFARPKVGVKFCGGNRTLKLLWPEQRFLSSY